MMMLIIILFKYVGILSYFFFLNYSQVQIKAFILQTQRKTKS